MNNNQNQFNSGRFSGKFSNSGKTPVNLNNAENDIPISPKSRRTMIILWWLSWIFCSGLLYNIYAGKTLRGIIWMLTGGCFLVGFCIDGYKIFHGEFTDKDGAYIIND